MSEVDIHWRSNAVTHVGTVRSVNEDAIYDNSELGVWAVADGMGGHEAGDVASTMLVRGLGEVSHNEKLSVVVDQVEAIAQVVHKSIRDHAAEVFGGRTMGCTVVSLVVRDDLGACIWAGDSRLYCLREGALKAISEDHSQVNEMLKNGMITPDQVPNHPKSNVITRAVGANHHLFLDTYIFNVESGDRFLLCSDGLYGDVPEDDILNILETRPLDSVADELLKAALERGARDNVSIIVVDV